MYGVLFARNYYYKSFIYRNMLVVLGRKLVKVVRFSNGEQVNGS